MKLRQFLAIVFTSLLITMLASSKWYIKVTYFTEFGCETELPKIVGPPLKLSEMELPYFIVQHSKQFLIWNVLGSVPFYA